MKLRQRLIVSISLVTGVSLSGAFLAVSAWFDFAQRRSFDESLIAVATSEAREAPRFHYRFSERAGPATSDVGPLNNFGVIYAADGGVLAASQPFERAPPRLADVRHAWLVPFDLPAHGLALRATLTEIPASGGKLLLIAASRAELDASSAFLHRAMLVALLLSAGWSSLLVVWLVRRQTQHHENIATVARRVANGDLDARVTTLAKDAEEAQLGRDVDQMIERLAGLVTAQRRFTANAAHELRSPIAVVYGELQQALRKPRDTDAYRASIQRALRGAARLKHLADDLLTLIRPSAERESLSVTLESVISGAAVPVEALALEKQVTLRLDPGNEALSLLGHPRDLERMLRNLLENAVRHARQGGRVELATQRRSGTLELAISDDGPGVADPERERVFDAFYRSPQTRANAPDGSGLGLAIAREIARAHGGDIAVADAGPGACFVVRLPV